jgi:mono/diheme cytochrome c family protein
METKKLYRLYAVASLLFLLVLAISPAKDYFTEWRYYQQEYKKLLSNQPRRMKPIQTGIRQIWNKDLDRVDRCTSCHLGLEGKELVGAESPFKPHPRVYHDLGEYGCTICHDGQGLATTAEKAHDGRPYWDEPVLPKEFIESSCGKCHKDTPVPEAPILTYGRQLLETYNCAGCHKIGDITKDYAPNLDGIGDKTTRGWLVRWLKDPRAFRPDTKMPDFKLSDAEADLLADFLMSFKKYRNDKKLEPIPPELTEEYPPDDWVDEGKTVFRLARCISCHLVDGKGGPLAPDLAKVASKARPEWLYSFLLAPKGFQPQAKMPQYGFTRQEAQAVTAYMMSEFVDWDAPPDTLEHTRDPNFYEKGLKLFNQYNCGGCHDLSGIPKIENMGPDLTDMGDRELYQLEFGKTDIPRTAPSYIYNKLKNPRQFLETARMPVYGFKKEELQAITTALLAMTEEPLPQKYLVPKKAQSTYDPQGEFGRIVEKYSCLSCHVINGQGFRLATDLSREGSQAQRAWVEKYFKIPYSMRPILTERMPNLFMSEAEIQTVVDYFNLVLRDDKIDTVHIPLDDAKMIAEGENLFFKRYGCQACHQVAGKGGYVGPPLDLTGDRLTAGWVYQWIKNPQQYVPDTIDPTAGLSDQEARAITAYLMSLKGE